MKNRCCKCAQEECSQCFERSEERRERIINLVKSSIDVVRLLCVATVAYNLGKFYGRNVKVIEYLGRSSDDEEDCSSNDEDSPDES